MDFFLSYNFVIDAYLKKENKGGINPNQSTNFASHHIYVKCVLTRLENWCESQCYININVFAFVESIIFDDIELADLLTLQTA